MGSPSSQIVRTRFAPSPTGYLHIGGARTALFSFLFARHHKGQFILRVEDTDKQRSTPEATEAILDGLKWLGLNWDEGPFFQSQRSDHYRAAIDKLFQVKRAYACDCSVAMLEEKRSAAMKAGRKPMYDGTCRNRNLPRGGNTVVRFLATPSGTTVVHDLIKGEVVFQNQELDDMVLQRADGSPTYNFVVVIDDIDMRISHVIRGDDHLNNTPKQIQLYQALAVPLPQFAHVPLILGEDKSRLSKRHGATSVQNYRDAGFLPQAMRNFLARLGWSWGDDEIFSLAELTEKFSLENVGKSAGVFNEDKLLWLNHHYLRQLSDVELNQALLPFIERLFGKVALDQLKTAAWSKLLPELRERCKTLEEFPQAAHYLFIDPKELDPQAVAEHLTAAMRAPLTELRQALAVCQPFSEAALELVFKSVLTQTGLKMKTLAQALRVALTGTTISPGIYLLLEVLGQQTVLRRLDRALQLIA